MQNALAFVSGPWAIVQSMMPCEAAVGVQDSVFQGCQVLSAVSTYMCHAESSVLSEPVRGVLDPVPCLNMCILFRIRCPKLASSGCCSLGLARGCWWIRGVTCKCAPPAWTGGLPPSPQVSPPNPEASVHQSVPQLFCYPACWSHCCSVYVAVCQCL